MEAEIINTFENKNIGVDFFNYYYSIFKDIRNNSAHPKNIVYKKRLINFESLKFFYMNQYRISKTNLNKFIANQSELTNLTEEDFLFLKLSSNNKILKFEKNIKRILNIRNINIFNLRTLDSLLLIEKIFYIDQILLNDIIEIIKDKIILLISNWPESAKKYFLQKISFDYNTFWKK